MSARERTSKPAACEQNDAPHAGVVVAINGNEATVRFTRGKMCEHCGACMSVGEKELELIVNNTLGAAVDDRVAVSLPPRRIVQASLLAYVIPLCALLAGVWLGSLHSDLFAMLFGVAGCLIAYLLLRIIEKRRNLRAAFQPQMTQILLPDEREETTLAE